MLLYPGAIMYTLGLLLQLLPVVLLVGLGFCIGSWRERRHLASLDARESQFADITVQNVKSVPNPHTVVQCTLVTGEAVIATDFFKSFVAALRNIVGGEIKTYETLMRRARREATLRMLEMARQAGATEIWNVRYETSNIRSSGDRRPQSPSVEVFAFGTAVRRN